MRSVGTGRACKSFPKDAYLTLVRSKDPDVVTSLVKREPKSMVWV
jgi:hypothetical protein